MKPSEAAKLAGLKSLAQLAEISGESVQTLNNWYKNEPRRFELVLKGAVFELTVERMSQALPRKHNAEVTGRSGAEFRLTDLLGVRYAQDWR